MQVERTSQIDFFGMKSDTVSGGRVSNTWVIYLLDRDNTGKLVLIPDKVYIRHLK